MKRYKPPRRFYVALVAIVLALVAAGFCIGCITMIVLAEEPEPVIVEIPAEPVYIRVPVVIPPEEPEVEPEVVAEPEPISLGEFKITYYCACAKCCGKNPGDPGYGITSTGAVATEGRTIAVDPKVIPYGTEVILRYADGTELTYIAEDCGGAIRNKRIDVYMESHQAALQAGVKTAEVLIKE